MPFSYFSRTSVESQLFKKSHCKPSFRPPTKGFYLRLDYKEKKTIKNLIVSHVSFYLENLSAFWREVAEKCCWDLPTSMKMTLETGEKVIKIINVEKRMQFYSYLFYGTLRRTYFFLKGDFCRDFFFFLCTIFNTAYFYIYEHEIVHLTIPSLCKCASSRDRWRYKLKRK